MNSLINYYKSFFLLKNIKNYTSELNQKPFEILLSSYNSKNFGRNEQFRNSEICYKIFIHTMIILFKKTEIRNDFSTKLENPKNLFLDLNLLDYLNHYLENKNRNRSIKFQFEHFIIEIQNQNIEEFGNYLKSHNINYFQSSDFFQELFDIQELNIDTIQIKIDSFELKKKNIQKSLGKYYSSLDSINFVIQLLSKAFDFNKSFVKILDPSCGSGLFLKGILDYYNKILFDNETLVILDIVAFDIDYKSLLSCTLIVEIFSLFFWKKNFVYNINLIHDDFLFPEKTPLQEFDIVIGNPPYIRERNFQKEYRRKLENSYEVFKGKSDLYFAFIEQTNNFLKPGGCFAFILARYWLESDSGKQLRLFVKKNFFINSLVDFQSFELFKNAKVHSMVISANKIKKEADNISNNVMIIKVACSNSKVEEKELFLELKDILKKNPQTVSLFKIFFLEQQEFQNPWFLLPKENIDLLRKLNSYNSMKLSSISSIKEGINTGADKVSKKHAEIDKKYQHEKGKGIFVISRKELNNLKLDDNEKKKYIKKWIKGKNISKWIIKEEIQPEWLIYFKNDSEISQKIFQHLLTYKPILENRAEILRNPKRNWFDIAWPRNSEIFDSKPKILIPYKAKIPMFVIDEYGYYTSADFRIIIINNPYDIFVVLGLLNSQLIKWMLNKMGKNLGKSQDFYSFIIKDLPIVYPDKNDAEKLKEIVKLIIRLTKESLLDKPNSYIKKLKINELELKLNIIVNKTYKLTNEEEIIINKIEN
jgi:adenine-specific DNA-methyltransferase